MADQDDSYEIGYKKPPAETRFTQGQSGNPKGRPKGAKNLATLIVKVGRERVRVTINGRTRTMTKLEAILLQLANKAISGEDRAAKEILHLLSLYEESDKSGLPQADQDEKDDATLDNIVKRILKSDPGSDDGNGGAPAAVSDWEK
jgi:uncharacterized protein DUF5681